MPKPLFKLGKETAKSKIAKSKGGIFISSSGDSTIITIKPAVGMLGDNPHITSDLMIAVDKVLHHWKK